MPRKPKQHLRDPANGKMSLCGRGSVRMAETSAHVTCQTCVVLAAGGKLEQQQLEKYGRPKDDLTRYTEQQRAFAEHPLVHTAPRKAALAVGYSASYAKSKAYQLREQLAPLIIQIQEDARKRNALSVARVQNELAAMGFANVADYYETVENGAMIPKKVNDLTREQTAAIQEMEVGEYTHPVTGATEFRITRMKLADKRANLVELGKTLGMFNPKGDGDERTRRQKEMRDIPTEALEAAEKLLLEAREEQREKRDSGDTVEGEYSELPDAVEQADPVES